MLHGVSGATVLSVVFGWSRVVILHKFSILGTYPFLGPFWLGELTFVGAFSPCPAFVDISEFYPLTPATSQIYEAKEKQETHSCVVLLDPRVLAILSCPHLSESYLFYVCLGFLVLVKRKNKEN